MSDYGFKVPVSGQKIPHGWFAALVRFVNSLLLHGDGRYTLVDHNENGTTVTLSPAVIAAIEKSGCAPAAPGPGVAQALSVSVSGNTATVSLSGSTQTVQFVAGSNVSITGNTNGQVVVSATGGTASPSSFGPPDYYADPIAVINENTSFPASFSCDYPVWIVGYATGRTWNAIQYLELEIESSPPGQTILQELVLIDTGRVTEDPSSWYTVPVYISIPANTEILFHTGSYEPPETVDLKILPCLTS